MLWNCDAETTAPIELLSRYEFCWGISDAPATEVMRVTSWGAVNAEDPSATNARTKGKKKKNKGRDERDGLPRTNLQRAGRYGFKCPVTRTREWCSTCVH